MILTIGEFKVHSNSFCLKILKTTSRWLKSDAQSRCQVLRYVVWASFWTTKILCAFLSCVTFKFGCNMNLTLPQSERRPCLASRQLLSMRGLPNLNSAKMLPYLLLVFNLFIQSNCKICPNAEGAVIFIANLNFQLTFSKRGYGISQTSVSDLLEARGSWTRKPVLQVFLNVVQPSWHCNVTSTCFL